MVRQGHPRASRAWLTVVFVCALNAVPAPAGAHPGRAQRAHPLSHGADPALAGLRAHAHVDRRAHAAGNRPPDWCGTELAAGDTRDELDNGTYRYHAIYLFPRDAAEDRFRALAAQIQAAAFDASALLERLYGRAIRFDMGTSCGERYLDISSLRASLTSADFKRAAARPNGTLDAVSAALQAAGFPVLRAGDDRRRAAALRRNYVVWLDAPALAYSCGVAQVYDDASRRQSNWNNYGGKVAVVFRSGDGFCGEAAVRHEIGHTLGALQADAPHAVAGHCDDAFEDTMCVGDAPRRGSGVFEDDFFDFGNDDYWDPPAGPALGWWTVDLNRFVCGRADCNVVAGAARTRAPRSNRR